MTLVSVLDTGIIAVTNEKISEITNDLLKTGLDRDNKRVQSI